LIEIFGGGIMPHNAVKTKLDEELWAKAKRAAKKQAKGGAISYALVMHIYQKMKGAA